MRKVVISSEKNKKETKIHLTTLRTPNGYCLNGFHVWVQGEWIGVYKTYSRAKAESRYGTY